MEIEIEPALLWDVRAAGRESLQSGSRIENVVNPGVGGNAVIAVAEDVLPVFIDVV